MLPAGKELFNRTSESGKETGGSFRKDEIICEVHIQVSRPLLALQFGDRSHTASSRAASSSTPIILGNVFEGDVGLRGPAANDVDDVGSAAAVVNRLDRSNSTLFVDARPSTGFDEDRFTNIKLSSRTGSISITGIVAVVTAKGVANAAHETPEDRVAERHCHESDICVLWPLQ